MNFANSQKESTIQDWNGLRQNNFFTFNRPKLEVGGDFCWVKNIESKMISISADSIGHGASAAKISSFCLHEIEQIVVNDRKLNPGSILTILHEKLQEFGQRKSVNNFNSVDASVVVFDSRNGLLEYASAKGKMLLLRNHNLIKLNTERISLGDLSNTNHNFRTRSMFVSEHDWIFQFSDGITDQFGGENDKKYKLQRLSEVIQKNEDSTPLSMKNNLVESINRWMGKREQTDDISMIGIHFQ